MGSMCDLCLRGILEGPLPVGVSTLRSWEQTSPAFIHLYPFDLVAPLVPPPVSALVVSPVVFPVVSPVARVLKELVQPPVADPVEEEILETSAVEGERKQMVVRPSLPR